MLIKQEIIDKLNNQLKHHYNLDTKTIFLITDNNRLISRIPIEVAAKVKKPLDSISKDIEERFLSEIFSISSKNGYLNFSLLNPISCFEQRYEELVKVDKIENDEINIALAGKGYLDEIEFIRLFSKAILQKAFLESLGIEVKLFIISDKIDEYISFKEILLNDEIKEKEHKTSILKLLKKDNLIFYASNRYLKKLDKALFSKMVKEKKVISFQQNYFKSDLFDISFQLDDNIAKFAIYYASSLQADEIDNEVLSFKENANIYYYLESTISRIIDLNIKGIEKNKKEVEDLIFPIIFFQNNYLALSFGGLVQEFITYLKDYLDKINNYFNNVDFRKRLEEKQITCLEERIFFCILKQLKVVKNSLKLIRNG